MTVTELPPEEEDASFEVPNEVTAALERESADLAWFVEQGRRLAWAHRKMEKIRASIEPQLDRVHAEEARLEGWATDQCAPIQRYVDYLTGALADYALRARERSPLDARGEPKVKSVSGPYVRVRTFLEGGGWTASEESLAWAEASRPELVETVRKLRVADAKRLPTLQVVAGVVVDTTTGQEVPGITVAPRTVKAAVDLLGEAS